MTTWQLCPSMVTLDIQETMMNPREKILHTPLRSRAQTKQIESERPPPFALPFISPHLSAPPPGCRYRSRC
jgi:hypothetical protein